MEIKNVLANKYFCSYHPWCDYDNLNDYIFMNSIVDIIYSDYEESITFTGIGASCAIIEGGILAILASRGRFIDSLHLFRKDNDIYHHYACTPDLNKHVVIADDMISSGETMRQIIESVRRRGDGRNAIIDVFVSNKNIFWEDMSSSTATYIQSNVRFIYLRK